MLDKINFGIEKFLESFSLKIFIDSGCGKKELLDTGDLFEDGLHYWQLFRLQETISLIHN
jgi:hypothetical protein